MEVRDRRRLLALGGSQPKAQGPRLDVARLPTAALDRLTQRHPDRDVVDRLSAERERRAALG